MKQILFITLDYPPRTGGVARYYSNLIKELDPKQVIVLAPCGHQTRTFDKNNDYTTIRKLLLNRFIWPHWLPMLWYIAQRIQKDNIQQVHVGNILPTGTVALIIKKLFRIPYVVYLHGLDIRLAIHRRKWITMKILDQALFIVVNSTNTRNFVQKIGTTNTRILRVYPGCSFDGSEIHDGIVHTIQKKYHLQGKRILLTVARLVERKGIDTVLHAVANIINQFPEMRYMIVGEGSYKQKLQGLIHELGLEKHVILAGRLPDNELPAFYKLAHIFIMVPKEVHEQYDVEGFGIVYLEANAFGTPVIASKIGGIGDAVLDGRTGLIVQQNNSEEVAAAIKRLLTNTELAKSMGEFGKQRVRKECTWSVRAQPLLQIVK